MEKSGIRTHRKQQIRRTRGAGYEAAQDFESAVSVPLRCKWDANRYKKRQVGEVKASSKVNRIAQETPDGLGKGVFYRSLGSHGFFEKGNALPVITTFDKFTRH
jgi:hypothetical protein